MRQIPHRACGDSCLHSKSQEGSTQKNERDCIKACQDVQWTHDTNTPRRSENNGIAERAVRRVKGGPAKAINQSGVPEEWWDCGTRCCCYMRSVHDKMTDGKTAYENRFTDKFDGLLIPFGAKVSCTPILLKDESRPHQLGKKMLPDIFMGYVLRAGGGWPGDMLIAEKLSAPERKLRQNVQAPRSRGCRR